MPYSLTLAPPVLFVSWRGYTAAELREVAERLADVRRSTGRPAVYVAQLPPGGDRVFSDGDQTTLLGFLQTILPHCATIHHIIEGDGFQKSARLAIVTTLAQGTSRPRDFHTHATVDEAIRAIKDLYGVDLRDKSSVAPNAPSERASGVFREAARIVEGLRPPPRKD